MTLDDMRLHPATDVTLSSRAKDEPADRFRFPAWHQN